ncbi:MAG: hypothetical protein V2J55_00025 [Candidatus Competibacteraceae bacterium]|jgi:hypothetical protein|nr:hypothetical protein [Candidatus Competibacteraceae bacterium]
MTMCRLASRTLGILLSVLPSVYAAESDETDVPSMELLEFLGEWETADGQWLPPTSLDTDESSLDENDQYGDDE